MRQHLSAACVVIGILAWSVGERAAAQGYIPQRPGGISPITQPVYSPYLNLLRPGGSTLQNYYGLVRPEFDLRNSAGQLQSAVSQNDLAINSLAYGSNPGYAPLVTGHVATFLNTRGHFLNLRGSGGLGSLAFGGSGGYGANGPGSSGPGSGYGGSGYGAGARSFGSYGGAGGASGLGAGGGLRPSLPPGGGGFGGYPR